MRESEPRGGRGRVEGVGRVEGAACVRVEEEGRTRERGRDSRSSIERDEVEEIREGTEERKSSWEVEADRFDCRSGSSGESCAEQDVKFRCNQQWSTRHAPARRSKRGRRRGRGPAETRPSGIAE